MPVITIDLGTGQTNEGQKKQLISRMTTDAAEISGIPTDKFIVYINEFPFENIGVGGKTIKDIKSGQ